MSAPRKITAWGTGRKLSLLGGLPDFQHTHHHDDVVRELVEALERIGWHELTDHEARDVARAALAKIAQEG